MRLFTGIDLSSEVLANLRSLTGKLQPAARINWSPIANLHITTKFIGEWPETQLAALKAAIEGVRKPAPFEVSVRGLGWFPNQNAPRVFWAGVEAPPALHDLARHTEDALESLGVAREDRRFSPHLTLARVKTPQNLGKFLQTIESLPSTEFGSFQVPAFHLYLSEPGPGGSVYTKLATFQLNGSAA